MTEHNVAPTDPAQHVMQIASGFIMSSAIHVATKLGIADRLASGPAATDDLAKATRTNEDALYRVLRLLASVGIFKEVAPKRFALTPAASMMRKDLPESLYGMLLFWTDDVHFRVHANLMDSVQTGKPAAEATLGMPVFEYLQRNPEYSEIFNNAMTTMSVAVVPATLEAYDFSDIGVLVDIAGGHGELLTSILRRYPTMRGVLTDIDHVIAGAIPRIKSLGLADRCQAVVADFFTSAPAGGDAYMMKNIIHDWDDEHCVQILRNIHAAMGPKRGKVLLLEMMVPPMNEPGFGKIIDIEMLLFPGGRERTEDEFRALFDQTGFELTKVIPTKSVAFIVEARKR